MIRDAMQDNKIGNIMDPTKFSRNYKMGSVEGNVIFEGNSYLPKEAMLEMTLRAFGYDIDMMEVSIFIVSSLSCVFVYFLEVATLKKKSAPPRQIGMEGTGFEPTVEALFGKNGFFPDTAMKTMYFVSENMPVTISEILQKIMPALRRDRMRVHRAICPVKINTKIP